MGEEGDVPGEIWEEYEAIEPKVEELRDRIEDARSFADILFTCPNV